MSVHFAKTKWFAPVAAIVAPDEVNSQSVTVSPACKQPIVIDWKKERLAWSIEEVDCVACVVMMAQLVQRRLDELVLPVRLPELLIDLYTYRADWWPEDQQYAGLCIEFPSLIWLSDSEENALAGIRKLVSRCIADMKANGELIPGPIGNPE